MWYIIKNLAIDIDSIKMTALAHPDVTYLASNLGESRKETEYWQHSECQNKNWAKNNNKQKL